MQFLEWRSEILLPEHLEVTQIAALHLHYFSLCIVVISVIIHSCTQQKLEQFKTVKRTLKVSVVYYFKKILLLSYLFCLPAKMPYIQQAWTQVMHGQTGSAIPPSGGNASRSTSTSAASAPPDGQSAQSSGRIQRTIPLDAANNGAPQHQPTDGEGLERDGQCASMASIQCMHNIVRSQIEALLTNKAAVPTDAEAFYQYTLSVETVLFCGRFSSQLTSKKRE